MEFSSSQEPPIKKRRFFQDPDEQPSDQGRYSPATDSPPSSQNHLAKDDGEVKVEGDGAHVLAERSHNIPDRTSVEAPVHPASPKNEVANVKFDLHMFESFVGAKVESGVLEVISAQCGSNLERAVNMYFDGTYKKFQKPAAKPPPPKQPAAATSRGESSSAVPTIAPTVAYKKMPRTRYIGALGVEGWATRSGTNIIKHGDVVRIERQKIKPPEPPKAKLKLGQPPAPPRQNTAAARRVDVIVRFTSSDGTEIGRLAKDTANWVSTLIDQQICEFQGVCVYAPERIRTNDTVYLQLRCSLLGSAFHNRGFQAKDKESTKNAWSDMFESQDEKDLRLRQVALVRLFQETNLQPTVTHAAGQDARKGLLQAAELDEQKAKEQKAKEQKLPEQKKALSSTEKKEGSSNPGSEDESDGGELEQDQLDELYRKAQSFDFNTPQAEPADTFSMTLRPYQKQSLHWMMAKEKDLKSNREPSMHPLWEEYTWPEKDVDDKSLPSVDGQAKFYVNPYSGDLSLDFPSQEQHCLGGILADEMGLGKTIQMLSLIHSHRSELAHKARLTNSGINTVNQLPRLGNVNGIVLDAPCTTLVIAPMSLLAQWQSEAEKASKEGTMKIALYYGNEKSDNLQALCCSGNASCAPDIVITSYGIALAEFTQIAAKNGDKNSHRGLFSLKFFRIILDEAHHIKNRASKTARACYELSAEHRWVLTGTPIVNRLEDLFSLVKFLGVEPWNNFSFWKTFITVPFESGDFMRALDVVQTVLEPLVMRRTKDMKTPEGLPLVPLPSKTIEVVEIELSKTERDIYDYIFNKAQKTFALNIAAGTVMKAFTTIFAQIMRLRQSCCHPILVRNKDVVADEVEAGAAADEAAGLGDDMDLQGLIEHFSAATDDSSKLNATFGAHALQEIRDEAEKECPLCFDEPMNDQLVTGCWHSACKKCLLDYITHQTDKGLLPKCFNCREAINSRDLFEVIRHEDDADDAQPVNSSRISLQRLGTNASSAKVVALLSHLRTLRKSHPRMKSVVFSQFTSFLTLIEPVLSRANIKFLRLDGTMAQKARAAVLREFTEGSGFLILLISLRAGGVGLNLTSAGRVFMMDPWWSFAVEAQAIDRVHRLGQTEEVEVKRFVVKGSVEERMLRVQERKKFIASSLGMMSNEEKKLQRIEDIKELLS